MKRARKLLVLLAGLIVVCAAAVLVLKLNQEPETDAEEEIIVFETSEDALVKFAVNYNGATMRFTKKNGIWTYDNDSKMPLNQQHFEKMTKELAPLKAGRDIGVQKDLAAYGLHQPKVSFTAETASQSITVRIGEASALGDERYFAVDDGTVYTGSKDLYSDFDNALFDYIEPEDIPDMSRTYGLRIVREDETIELVCETKAETNTWYLIDEGEGIELDYEETVDFIDTITDIAWKKTVAWKPSEEELNALGLSDPIVVIVAYLDNTLTVCEQVFYVGSDSDGTYYARAQGSFRVHKIDDKVGNAAANASFRSGIKVG